MKKFLFVLPVFLMGINSTSANTLGADFTALCSLFEEALSLNADPEVTSQYMQDNLEYRVESDEIIDFYDALFLVAPDERYEVLKQAAESSMDDSWDCPAFNTYVK
jgi:hypothetical protein